MARKKVVIKYGGHAMDSPEHADAFEKDISRLSGDSWDFVIVHGGGPQINALLERLRLESHFVDGLRVTDAPALEAVEMALCATVNKAVVRKLEKNGLAVAGISGEDGNMLIARQLDQRLGRVGEVEKVNPGLLKALLQGGFIPVVAPLGLDAHGAPLNINADTAAGAIAGAIQADYFILISDVPGVLDAQGKLLRNLTGGEIPALREAGVISGGMIPKTGACLHALKLGCKRALILDGRQSGSLKRFLLDNEPLGTTITL